MCVPPSLCVCVCVYMQKTQRHLHAHAAPQEFVNLHTHRNTQARTGSEGRRRWLPSSVGLLSTVRVYTVVFSTE